MSAQNLFHKLTRRSITPISGLIDFAGYSDRCGGVPSKRPSLLPRTVLTAAVCLAAVASFAEVTSGPQPVKRGPMATVAPTAAHLSGTSLQIPIGSGFMQPEQVAADSNGNLYIADVLTNNVYKETLVAGVYSQSILRANLGGPVGVAVDKNGDVYIADSDNSRVLKELLEPSGTYTETVVPTTGLGGIVFDLAVDTKGNIYIADALNNRVVKETASGSTYTQSVLPATGLLSPEGVAVDNVGNVYIADSFNNRIVKETVSGSTYTQSVVVPEVLPLGPSGLNAPGQIIVVGTTLYIADTLNSRVAMATYNATTKTYSLSTVSTGALNAPTGVARDGSGNLFIADTNDQRVIEVSSGSNTDFGAVPLGTTSQTATLTFTFDAGGPIGAPGVGTQLGGTGAFAITGGTCTRGATFATGKTCTVQLSFKPSTVGFAYGFARLTSSSNSTIALVDVSGTGLGSKLIYPNNATDSLIGANLNGPQGVVVDLSGNVYIADTKNNQVLKETVAGGATYTKSVVAKSLDAPTSIAVDASGNVFFTNSGAKSVVEETPGTGGAYTQTIVYTAPAHGTANDDPGSLVLDAGGNLWVAFPGKLQEYSLVSGTWKAKSSIIISGTTTTKNGVVTVAIIPISLAIDEEGGFYVGEAANSTLGTPQRVMSYLPKSGSYAQLLVESGTYPKTIAVDRIGNVWLIDDSNSAHVFVPTGATQGNSNGGYYAGVTLKTHSQLGQAEGLAVDANEIVYIANTGLSQVLHESWGTVPIDNFPITVVDSTSGAIVQSVLNIGNAAVNFAVPATGQNPTVTGAFVLNTGDASACPVLTTSSDPAALDPGAECSVSLSFLPTSVANFNGTLSYQANNGSQTRFGFSLSGRGIATIPSITWPAPAAIAYGTPLSSTQLDATASYNGQTVPGTFTYSPDIGAVLNAGTQTLNVQFAPSVPGYSGTSANVTIVVTKVPLTLVADSYSRLYGSANPPFTISYLGFVNGDGPDSLNGAAVLSTEATPQFPWGYYPITLSQGNLSSGNYSFTFVDGTLVVNQIQLSVQANDMTVATPSDIPNPYPCTIIGQFANGESAATVISGMCTTDAQSYTNATAGSYPIVPSIGTLSALNYTFTNFIDGTLTISSSQVKPVKSSPAARRAPASKGARARAEKRAMPRAR